MTRTARECHRPVNLNLFAKCSPLFFQVHGHYSPSEASDVGAHSDWSDLRHLVEFVWCGAAKPDVRNDGTAGIRDRLLSKLA